MVASAASVVTMKTTYTDTIKKRPLHIYVNLLKMNAVYFQSIILLQEMWLYKNAMHQKRIHSMLIYGNDNAASTSTQITKVT